MTHRRRISDRELHDIVLAWRGSLTGLHDSLHALNVGVGIQRLRREWFAQGRRVREQFRR